MTNADFINSRILFSDREYWYEQARIALRKRLQYAPDGKKPHAKNVILFVGDGMGVATTTAARILRGQRMGKSGEDHELAWDSFPAVALAKVSGRKYSCVYIKPGAYSRDSF
ncbi:hypothetical protein GWI33_013840 [Rhynchophorus ferrugineus]|uniref:alkaline phosphatase n=1 Tax=Rhynchophorus ferrugineus TaxID=354439 RepID=A0A834I7C8_RHYFE|nr:hypothetical protein GWI33_013840 [Rhynchophorus ferrugineus]